ncbi:hypothetical protein [Halobacteriovorax sp.]|uniref:hypothetical protein n=1 Tax=Halobacteriovorax sp. TaxID=2020862 RepID=UPI003AF2290F
MNIVLDGIYDKRSLQVAKTLAKGCYGFDFRPRSFNFIQGYVLEELLNAHDLKQDDIVELHFENDSEFIIKSIIDTVEKYHPKVRLNFGLSSNHDKKILEAFNRAFSITFDEKDNLVYEKISSPLCQSVVLNYEFLHSMADKGLLNSFIVNFYSKVMRVKNEKFQLGIKLNWNSNISMSVIESLDPDYLKFEINSQVERCYRNIDAPKLSEYIEYARKTLAI